MRLSLASIAAFFFLSSPVLAQIAVSPVAEGTQLTQQFSSDLYCENIYVQKSGNTWKVVPGSAESLQDPSIENLRACLGRAGQVPVIDVVVFSVAIQEKCDTDFRCEVSVNGNQRATGCHSAYLKEIYKSNSPRSAGYFACNSSFAGRKGLLNVFDFKNPISIKVLTEALQTEPLKAAASAIAQSRYQKILDVALNAKLTECNRCVDELNAINFLFGFFHTQTSPANLEAAAINYLNLSGQRKIPEWARSHLSPNVIENVEARGTEIWRARYAEQARVALAPAANAKEVRAFIQRYEKEDPLTWKSTDFDKLVPVAQRREHEILDKQQAQAKIEARQKTEAEQKSRQAEAQRIADWRKTLVVGSDTFCGTVIELRSPMVKLAINAQLQGYANESWLKISEIYPPQYGCRNTNGRLSTLK